MAKNERNIAILFPGLGYTCDRSLLYYSGKLLQGLGYEVIRLSYGGFPAGLKGDEAEIRQCVAIALEQAEEQLKEVDFSVYDDVLFAGKSIGTVVALQYAQNHVVDARFVLLTPLEQSFDVPATVEDPKAISSDRADALQGNRAAALQGNQAIAFHGTADPWARTGTIIDACKSRNISLHLIADANHSLETGDVSKDIDNLQHVIEQIRMFAGGLADAVNITDTVSVNV